jgi:predicted regulator of Ras-like GTPase activity (Roadblock/LC7/MglB family)
LTVSLTTVNGAWPDSVKQEIAQQNLKEANVALPMASVEMGLKTGKLVFPWREIAGWLEPKPFTTSSCGDTLVELPLKVIAPKFIEQHKPTKVQRKVTIGENIPDIFSGGAAAPKPPVAAAPVAAPIPVSAPASAPSLPKLPSAPSVAPAGAPASAKVPTTLGEVFGEAEKADWTPRDIVAKASHLKGLAGAVIATHDGLMVAGELPAPMKADMMAAFLPQIFSRMNQYGKELQIGGEVTSMNITFEKVPWQISKLGKVYFAAAGRTSEPLPTAQLAVICGELAKQNK